MRNSILILFCLFVGSANATVIDFTVFPFGDTGSTTLVTPEATFNSFEGNFYVGAAGVASEICPISTSSFSCESDFEAIFTQLVNNLTFVTSAFDPGDSVEIFAYDLGNNLLGSVVQGAAGLVDMTAYSGIKRLFFDDSSSGAGFGYDQFTFDVDDTTVPAPATVLLFGIGLAGMGWSRRRKA